MSTARIVLLVCLGTPLLLLWLAVLVAGWKVTVGLYRGKSLGMLLLALLVRPWSEPFRLRSDCPDPALLRTARLHDRLLRWLLISAAGAILTIALVVTFG